MKRGIILLIAFVAGILAGQGYHATQAALDPTNYDDVAFPSNVYSGITGRAVERLSPSNHISEDQIHVYKDRIVIDLPNAIYAKFGPTNSMEPVLDTEANAIEIKPESAEQVREGDIIAYKNTCTDGGTIIHRVIKQGEDQLGPYWITKGDNLKEADPCKVRLDEIVGVVAVLLY